MPFSTLRVAAPPPLATATPIPGRRGLIGRSVAEGHASVSRQLLSLRVGKPLLVAHGVDEDIAIQVEASRLVLSFAISFSLTFGT